MRFLVTGATGFVGGAIARRLIAQGHSVRALVRPESRSTLPEDPAIEAVAGNVTDRPSVEKAIEGADGVFHVAAVYSYWHRDPSETYRVNVDGTENVLAAAKSSGIGRAVFTSTVATLKWPGKDLLADESFVASLDDLPGHYKRSKLMAEQAALSLNDAGFEVVVTNPTAPFGPGDARPTPTGRLVLEFLNHRFPGYVNSGVNACDVEDVAEGHLLAFFKGRAGERYILGSENVSLRGIYDRLARVTGLSRRPVRTPFALAMALGAIDSVLEGRILRREPYIPLEGLRVAKHPMYVDCTKAITELGLPTRPVEESLRRSVDWFVENGYSNAKVRGPRSLDNGDEASVKA